MDLDRLAAELTLLRGEFPDLEHLQHGGANWVRLPRYAVPAGWSHRVVEAVFQAPAEVGAAPYAFCVRPALTLAAGGQPGNYTAPVVTPWGSDFAQFSWAPGEPWQPKADVGAGPNLLRFARSFADRLAEAS